MSSASSSMNPLSTKSNNTIDTTTTSLLLTATTTAAAATTTTTTPTAAADDEDEGPKQAQKSKFPTTLADLQQQQQHCAPFDSDDDDDDTRNLYKTIKSLRLATLSIRNRLASIQSDSRFVQAVAAHYGSLPLIANERCGSWYIPPSRKAGSVYFKSTDGHHGQWAFSLRRLNLNLLGILGQERNGAVIVDSTRRGKRVPDALAKTVGIWCAVVNAVLFPEYHSRAKAAARRGGARVVELWEDVGESERSQIEAKLGGWCDAFSSLGLDLRKLREEVRRPIRCLWVVNGEWAPEDEEEEEKEENEYTERKKVIEGWKRREWNLLVLCSASRVVKGAEMSQGGYIQGSGDDHEAWSRGLTPDLFWINRDRLEGLGEEEMVGKIEELVRENREERQGQVGAYTCVEKVGTIYIGVGPVKETQGWDLLINCQAESEGKRVLGLKCRAGKLGSRDLRETLPLVQAFDIATILERRKQECRILITCDSGKDLSVGVAVVLLCLYYGDDGKLCRQPVSGRAVDKHLVKQRLTWITSSKSDANPSRATLQAVNSFIIGRPD